MKLSTSTTITLKGRERETLARCLKLFLRSDLKEDGERKGLVVDSDVLLAILKELEPGAVRMTSGHDSVKTIEYQLTEKKL